MSSDMENARLLSGNGEEPCANCSWKEELKDFNKLKKGDHLCYNGQNSGKSFYCWKKSFYKHHAIVVDVKPKDPPPAVSISADVKVIEYCESEEDNTMNIQENEYYFDLKSKQQMSIVRYHCTTYPVEKIIQLAMQRLREKKYNVRANNCEHFCNFCCIGLKESLQVNKCCAYFNCLKFCGFDVGKVLRFILLVAILSTNDAFRNELISGFILGSLLLAYTVISLLQRCHYFFLVHKCEEPCSKLICCNRKCLERNKNKCSICHRYYNRVKMRILIVLWICQASSFGLLVFLIREHWNHWIILCIEIGISVVTIVILMCIPCLMQRCCPHPRKNKPQNN